MARATKTVIVWTCDSKFCRTELVTDDENRKPEGITGTVDDPDTQEQLSWFACKPAHIKDAVIAVLEA